jgi:hypothetical protein
MKLITGAHAPPTTQSATINGYAVRNTTRANAVDAVINSHHRTNAAGSGV